MEYWRIPQRKKKLVALRMYYRAEYTAYFVKQVQQMLANGYTLDELLAAVIDDAMMEMIRRAATQDRSAVV